MGLGDDIENARRADQAAEAQAEAWARLGGRPDDPVPYRPEGEWAALVREVSPLVKWRVGWRPLPWWDCAIDEVRLYRDPDGQVRLTESRKRPGRFRSRYPGQWVTAIHIGHLGGEYGSSGDAYFLEDGRVAFKGKWSGGMPYIDYVRQKLTWWLK